MDPTATDDGPTLASAGPPRKTNLQSIDDFMKEHGEVDAQKIADSLLASIASDLTKKQKKALAQAARERLEAERKDKKAALEAEQKSINQQAREAVEDLGVENWVGKLLEYRNAHPKGLQGVIYTEEAVGPAPFRFRCTVSIHESPHIFGRSLSFSNKKDAKRYASKKAIDWLIGNGYMPADGSVKFSKAPPPPIIKSFGSVQPVTSALTGNPKPVPSSSSAGQVPEMCSRLGFNLPTYELTKDSEIAAFWSGYAHFRGDPRVEGKIGEVKGVFGKNNAKEQIAIEVLSFLKDIERQRMKMANKTDEVEEEGRKRKRDSVISSKEISEKQVKAKA